jgi:hypothetical protein
VGQLPENLARVYGLIEVIFARLNGSAKVPDAEERERQPVPDDVVVPKNPGDLPP